MVLFSHGLKKYVMYIVRNRGNDQEMKVKIAVFIKYGIVPVYNSTKKCLPPSRVQRNRHFQVLAHGLLDP